MTAPRSAARSADGRGPPSSSAVVQRRLRGGEGRPSRRPAWTRGRGCRSCRAPGPSVTLSPRAPRTEVNLRRPEQKLTFCLLSGGQACRSVEPTPARPSTARPTGSSAGRRSPTAAEEFVEDDAADSAGPRAPAPPPGTGPGAPDQRALSPWGSEFSERGPPCPSPGRARAAPGGRACDLVSASARWSPDRQTSRQDRLSTGWVPTRVAGAGRLRTVSAVPATDAPGHPAADR